MDDYGDINFWQFVHKDQMDISVGTEIINCEDSELLFEGFWGTDGTTGDSDGTMPTVESVVLPAQSESASQTKQAEVNSGPRNETEMDVETQHRSRKPHAEIYGSPDAIDTRVPSASLKHVDCTGSQLGNLVETTTKIINPDIIPQSDDLQFQGRACERTGITRTMDATSRLKAAIGTPVTTQPSETARCSCPCANVLEAHQKMDHRRGPSSAPHAAKLPLRDPGVSDCDLDTTSQKTLASPFLKVHRRPRPKRLIIDLTEDDDPEIAIGPISTDPMATPAQGNQSHVSDRPRPNNNKRKNGHPTASISRVRKRAKLHRKSKSSDHSYTDLQTAFMKPVVQLAIAGVAEFDADIREIDEERQAFVDENAMYSPIKVFSFLEANSQAKQAALDRRDMWSKVLQHLEAWDVKDKEVTARLETRGKSSTKR